MRIAFIGGYGHHYLKDWIPEVAQQEPVAVAVASDGAEPGAAQALTGRVGAEEWFDTPEELLDQFAPDVVSLGAVYGLNGVIAAQVLERNVPVVTDKPAAVNWEQLERLRELARDPRRVLITEFPFRAQPEFRAAHAAVQQGRIGDVVLATAQKSYRFGNRRPAWYADRARYGGTMLWVASHAIDAISYCSGQGYSRVVGVQGNLSKPDYGTMEDHCVAMFELENGGSAVVHADYLRPAGAPTHGDDRLRLVGSRGVLEVRDGRCRLMSGSEAEADITDSAPGRAVHQEIAAALLGEGSALYSTAHSLEMAAALLKARDAADRRQWENV